MKENEIQYRALSLTFREKEENNELLLDGYFVIYEDETQLWEGMYEKIDRHAFDGELNKDIRALYNHDTSKVLGRTKNKTLQLISDNKGLRGIVKLNKDDPESFSLYQKVKRGDIDQCSFGFIPTNIECQNRDDGSILSVVKKCELIEVSVVAFPAYENTSIKARKNDFKKQKLEEFKNNLKERLGNSKC